MENFSGKEFKLGILGGGQLGRMMIREAIKFNISTSVLDPNPAAPCAEIASEFVVGDFRDYESVLKFGRGMNVVTIEIEDVSVEALKVLQSEGVKVFPDPKVIELIQDKGTQKQFYRLHGIPTSEFQLVEDFQEDTWPLPFVQKMRRGGYDGRGVQVLRSASDFSKKLPGPSLLERLVDIEKEISVIVARNESGETVAYPTVELDFHPVANLVEFLICPADISKDLEQEAEDLAMRLAQELNLVGILAVEMFIDKSGNILVNEIAPRTHNSGHQSIEGNLTSQFEQQLRAVCGMPLGSTAIVQPSVMLNLLGDANSEGEAVYEGLEETLRIPGVYPHLYGKKDTKAFRKMGHVTVLNPDLKQALGYARQIKSTLKVVGRQD
jgi:5-(carboxyamino)imidazole ribonucleotide synthase